MAYWLLTQLKIPAIVATLGTLASQDHAAMDRGNGLKDYPGLKQPLLRCFWEFPHRLVYPRVTLLMASLPAKTAFWP